MGQRTDAAELHGRISGAIAAAGAEETGPEHADALVWLPVGTPERLHEVLDKGPGIRWVQLPWAGVDSFAGSGLFQRPGVTFTSLKGALGGQVAEHALMLILIGLRNVVAQARTPRWHNPEPVGLAGRRVTIVGAGGIGRYLLSLLQPAGCRITMVRRRAGDHVEGADRTAGIEELGALLPVTDVLVLALPLTEATRGLIGAPELGALPPHAVVVNVARGGHLDQDALVTVLEQGEIAAAGLDVTEPEPLPEDHPLWHMDKVMITSHTADAVDYVNDALVRRTEVNLARFGAGETLEGVIDPELLY